MDKSSFPLKEHPDVVWELAQERFKSAERYDRAYARLKLQNLADQGNRRAALELAQKVAPEEQKKIGFALKSKTYRLSEVCDP